MSTPAYNEGCGVVFDRATFLWHLPRCEPCQQPGVVYRFLMTLGDMRQPLTLVPQEEEEVA